MSAPIASGEAKEKAGLRTRIASRLSLVGGRGEGGCAAARGLPTMWGPAARLFAKNVPRHVFLTLRPSQGSIPLLFEKKKAAPKAAFFFWSGRGESNPRIQLGKLMFCH